jgi:predicted ribosomally synthesized peptide with SipW-like signal peptide
MNARVDNRANSRTTPCGSGVRAYREPNHRLRSYIMRLVFSLIIMGMLLAGIGGTFASFIDTNSSASNSFTTGTLSLLLGNGAIPASYTAGVSGSFGGSGLMPGAAIGPSTVMLKNAGGLAADHLDIKFQNTVVNNPSYNAADLGADIANMSSVMVVSTLTCGATNLLAYSGGAFTNPYIQAADVAGNHDGVITLNELNNVIIQGLAAPSANGGTAAFVIAMSIPSATGNGIQGDSVTTVVTFGLFQTSGQHLS